MKVRVITLECTPEKQMRHIEAAIENRLDALSNAGRDQDEEFVAMFNFLCDPGVTGYEAP